MKRKWFRYLVVFMLLLPFACKAEPNWPPQIGIPYPDLEWLDPQGRSVRLSSFTGKVLIIEPVGMNCPACQAFSGAHRYGSYQNIRAQQGVSSIAEYFPKFTGGLTLDDKRLVFVQLLLYDMKMGPPTVEDARSWRKHFHLDEHKNHYVLVHKKDLRGPASYDLIPGFQLVDKDFILRSDSTGHSPTDSLYRTLLPMVPKLLK